MKRALGVVVLMMGVVGHRSVVAARSAGNTDDAPVSVDLAWGVLDGCVDDPPRPPDWARPFDVDDLKRWACAEAARTVATTGADADQERLWSLFDAVPDESPLSADVLDASLDRRVESALAALGGTSRPVAIEPVAADHEMPEFLRDGPADLQEAWRLYESVVATQGKAFQAPAEGTAIVFHVNQSAFRRTIAAFLRGRIPPRAAMAELSRYQWGGGCGNGSEALFVRRAKVQLIAHLQLGRIDLALAASGWLTGRYLDTGGEASGSDPRLLAAAGIDWERYHLGGLLSGRLDLAVPLALRGSERTARSLLEAVRVISAAGEAAPRDASESLLFPMAALVEPEWSRPDLVGVDSHEIGPRDPEAERLHADVQEGALDLLADRVGPEAGRQEAETASHLLAMLGRTESRDAFRTMLESHYDQVRTNGVIGLRALGENPPDAQPSRPVVFQLVADGKPVVSHMVQVTLGSGNDGEAIGAQTDSGGLTSLDRDRFADPRRRVSSLRFQSADLAAVTGEWFDVTVDAPSDLDAVTTVSFRTGTLTVIIPPELLHEAEAGPLTLNLCAMRDHDRSGEGTSFVAVDLPVPSGRLTFSHLQHGRYGVWLIRGSRFYASPVVEVGADPATTAVALDPDYSPDDERDDRAANPTNQPL